MTNPHVQLGLGLIRIGKPWGFINASVPEPSDIEQLLATAIDLGITIFDTAASYGDSEAHLGRFLSQLDSRIRPTLTIATKFGEHWNPATGQPFVDHSIDALRRSLETSLSRLGSIDLLQLHKTTPAVLHSRDLELALLHASQAGVSAFGASVADLESAEIALSMGCFSMLQLPFHHQNATFLPILQQAAARGLHIWTNRPFNMGKSLYSSGEIQPVSAEDCFRAILAAPFRGAILTGTGSALHLRQNLAAFRAAQG